MPCKKPSGRSWRLITFDPGLWGAKRFSSPTLSKKYGETVCTAGVREDGSWVRLYPIPFRLLDYKDRYQKFDWIETRLVRNSKDPRPETFHLADTQQVGRMETVDNWRERRELMLKQAKVYDRLEPLIEAAHARRSRMAAKMSTITSAFAFAPCGPP